jgi:hypothetical protein
MKVIPGSKITAAITWFAMVGVSASLVACGGSDDDATSSSTTMIVRGTAATGAALSGASISVTCATGTGAATSNSSGNYSASISNGKGPCVLTATKGTTTLNSVTPGAGVANITPLTDLLTNYLATRAGTSVSNLLTNTNGKAILSDTQALTDGQNGVAAMLKTNYNVTISTTSFLTASITTPESGTQSASDKDLDLLKAANILTSDGNVTSDASTTVKTEAAKTAPYVAPTGAS